MNISVAGTGYVGLVTAVCLAEKGHFVYCVDVDQKKIHKLSEGKLPFYEPGLEDMIRRNISKMTFTSDYTKAYKDSDAIMICVGTPEKGDGSANLQFVYQVALQIAESIEKDCIVIMKSTVPVGTCDKVEKMIKENMRYNVDVEVVSNPEFLSQGSAIKDTLQSHRIVLGVKSKKAENVMKQIYDNFQIPYIVTDRKSAEMIKYASNNFLALKISFINEIANLCEIVGADIDDVAKGIGMDPRIGNRFLNAGIGYGGSCFPKDTKALHWLANYNDYELKTIKATIEVNENQKMKLIKKAKKYFDSFQNVAVAVLGLTFKPGTDDLRDAPSLANIQLLIEDGAKVKVWDPAGMEKFRKMFGDAVAYGQSIEDTITDADVCFIFTEWPEIKQFDLNKYTKLMKIPLVLDGRNCYSLDRAQEAGLIYESIGRKAIIPDGNFSLVVQKNQPLSVR